SGTIAADVSNAGTLSPGASVGSLSITGTYTQMGSGVLTSEIGGSATCTAHDQLTITGAATLGGTLTISTSDGCTPSAGQSFVILTFGARSGDFTTINGLAPRFTRSYDSTSLTLTATATP